MNAVLSPIFSEFEYMAAAACYDPLFRAKVKKALDDPRPSMPRDEAIARIDKLLAEKRKACAVSQSATTLQTSQIVKIHHAR